MGLHDGKVTMVTGSTRGLGNSMALRFAQEGASVVIMGRTYEAAEKAANKIKVETGAAVLPLACNVTDREQIAAAVAKTIDTFGKIDILVNNAGITWDASFMKMTDEAWQSVIDSDLTSVFLFTQEVAKYMREARWGRVINITSMTGQMGNFGQANYGAAKAGIIGLTKTLAIELGRRNISVNAVSPGLFDSDMTAKMPKEAYQANIDAIPLGRAGQPREVAALVSFLASEDAGFINGAVISINGGMYR